MSRDVDILYTQNIITSFQTESYLYILICLESHSIVSDIPEFVLFPIWHITVIPVLNRMKCKLRCL